MAYLYVDIMYVYKLIAVWNQYSRTYWTFLLDIRISFSYTEKYDCSVFAGIAAVRQLGAGQIRGNTALIQSLIHFDGEKFVMRIGPNVHLIRNWNLRVYYKIGSLIVRSRFLGPFECWNQRLNKNARIRMFL